jgi:hypothetical protein
MPNQAVPIRARRTGAALVLALALAPALATGPAPAASPPRAIDTTHAEAKRINQGNPFVVHGGPGAPMIGVVHAPPPRDKKKGGKASE